MGYGWKSKEFQRAAGVAALSLVFWGKGQLVHGALKKIPGVSHAAGWLTRH
ncbi:hypothetical protein [Streptomyces sp. NPDC048357]|uniref:hypothetical protein n=1 Tax=Streptomyces sp. NPDC048357 TaxID=3154719 RepID=UPI003438F899